MTAALHIRRLLPAAVAVIAALAALLALASGAAQAQTPVPTATPLPPLSVTGTLDVVITVGSSSGDYGYDSGSYGSLGSGQFPAGLFTDNTPRVVDELYEDAAGYWYFTYSGGAANAWLADADDLDNIEVSVAYEDGRDSRAFVLGGFIDSRPGDRGLKLDPPLPSRDWDSKEDEDITVSFGLHAAEAAPLVLSAAMTDPAVEAGTWAELINKAPGGPVGVQLMLTLFAFYGIGLKARDGRTIMVALVSLLIIPAGMSVIGLGGWMMATITVLCVASGAMVHRAVAQARG